MRGKGIGRLLIGAGVVLLGLMLVGSLAGRMFGPRWRDSDPPQGYGQGFQQGGPQGGPGFQQGYGPQGGPGFQQGGPMGREGRGPQMEGRGWQGREGRGPMGHHHGPGWFFFPFFWIGLMTKLALFGLVGALIWRSLQLRRHDGGTPPPTNDPRVV